MGFVVDKVELPLLRFSPAVSFHQRSVSLFILIPEQREGQEGETRELSNEEMLFRMSVKRAIEK